MRLHHLLTALIALVLVAPCVVTSAAQPCPPGATPTAACLAAALRAPSQQISSAAPAVTVAPGDLSQETFDTLPIGAVIEVGAGVHRLEEPLHPRRGQRIVGAPGALLSGSRIAEDFDRHGDLWVLEGQTQDFDRHGDCRDDMPACDRPETVFIDDEPLEQVLSLDDVTAGSFYFDEASDQITLADDPAGRTVEVTVAEAALLGADDGEEAGDVTVTGLIVEKFATPAQTGAIDSLGAPGWRIESNVVRLNHGAGVVADTRSMVRRNRIVDNGQLGLGGTGENLLVEHNEIARNGWAGFDRGWEAGGAKWARTDGLVVRENWVHDNDGPGLWTDINNVDTRYERNVVERNFDAGIFHEISYDAVITGNVVERNGHGDPRWGYGAGIQIAHSPRVQVLDNAVRHNARGITLIQQERADEATHGPHELADVEVAGNDVHMTAGFTGLVQDIGDDSYFESRNIRFHGNRYTVDGVDEPFAWANDMLTLDEWRAAGHDTG